MKLVLVEHVLHPVVLTFNIFHILDQRRQRILKPLKKDNVLPAAIVVLSLKEIESIRNQSKGTWTSSGEASLPLSSSNKVSILSPLVARNLLKKKKCASACHWKLFRSLHVMSILKGCQVWPSIALRSTRELNCGVLQYDQNQMKLTWYYLCPCCQQKSSRLPGLADAWSAKYEW